MKVASLPSIMARSSCFIFIIFFLCFSVHACNARSIRLGNAGSAKELLSCKLVKKFRPTVDPFQPGAALIGRVQSSKLRRELKKHKGLYEEMKYVSGRSSDVVPFRFISLEGSVSLHVPRTKKDKLPGFYADYSRPRTRPPSHN